VTNENVNANSFAAQEEQGDEPYAELADISVDGPFRRQDVARALIARV
jgi:hypothetical protein